MLRRAIYEEVIFRLMTVGYLRVLLAHRPVSIPALELTGELLFVSLAVSFSITM